MTPEDAAQLFELAKWPQVVLAITVLFGWIVLLIGNGLLSVQYFKPSKALVAVAFCVVILMAVPFTIAFVPGATNRPMLSMLVLDALIVSVLVGVTGGSERSCFGPLYLLIPTFGLLVFGPGPEVYLVSGVSVACFVVTMLIGDRFFPAYSDSLSVSSRLACTILTIGCLGIAIFVDWKKTVQERQTHQKLADQIAAIELPLSYDEFETQIKQLKGNETTDVGVLRDHYNGKRVRWTVRFADTSDSGLQGWLFVNFEGEGEAGSERTLRWFMLPASQWQALGRVRRDERLFVDGLILFRDTPQLFPISVTRSRQ